MKMVMIFRMDAQHSVDGAFVKYYVDHPAATAAIEVLESIGWLCDAWAEEVPDFFADVLLQVEGVWPVIETEQICASIERANKLPSKADGASVSQIG